MGTKKEIFEACRSLYKKSYIAVKDTAENKLKFKDSTLVTEGFDVLLQYSLISLAVSDEDFDKNEMLFIKSITASGDFISYVDKMAHMDVTWEQFYDFSLARIKRILEIVEPNMKNIARGLSPVFQACDPSLGEHVMGIFLGLSKMDGDSSGENFSKSYLILDVLGGKHI